MEFRKIDKSNYWDCMALTIDDSQEGFVADNKQSLVEAAYEDGLYTLGIYHEETMVGFVLYDYDDTFSGWSMSRFMIGKQFQGKGYGKQAAIAFLEYFKSKHNLCLFSISNYFLPSHSFSFFIGLRLFAEDFLSCIYQQIHLFSSPYCNSYII